MFCVSRTSRATFFTWVYLPKTIDLLFYALLMNPFSFLLSCYIFLLSKVFSSYPNTDNQDGLWSDAIWIMELFLYQSSKKVQLCINVCDFDIYLFSHRLQKYLNLKTGSQTRQLSRKEPSAWWPRSMAFQLLMSPGAGELGASHLCHSFPSLILRKLKQGPIFLCFTSALISCLCG